jgi:hypothetical protein
MPVATLPVSTSGPTDTTATFRVPVADPVAAPMLRLCEPWPTVDGDERPGDRTTAVAVDGARPVALWLVAGNFDRVVPVTLRARATEDPRRVLRRAMDRPEGCRFDPVVCVDDLDRLVGIVPVEALARHVAVA